MWFCSLKAELISQLLTYLKSKGDEDIGLRARVRVQKSKVSIKAKHVLIPCHIILDIKVILSIPFLFAGFKTV